MKLDASSHRIEIPCPACGEKHAQTVGWLKAHQHIACSCGSTFGVDVVKFEQGVAQAEKCLDQLGATLRRLGK